MSQSWSGSFERALRLFDSFIRRPDQKYEDVRKRSILVFFYLIGIPILLGFGAHHIHGGRLARGSLLLLLGLVLLTFLISLRYSTRDLLILRTTVLLLGGYLVFLTAYGGAYGSRLLWIFLFPLVSSFLLGHREGLLWGTGTLALSLIIFMDPGSILGAYPYGTPTKVRFLFSYSLVGLMSYIVEAARQKYQQGMEEEHSKLVAEVDERRRAEKELRKSEVTLRAILAASPVGIGLARDRVLAWHSQAMYRLTGFEPDTMAGKSARILYASDEEYERVGRDLYGGIQERGIGQTETRWVGKNGLGIDLYLQASPLDPSDASKGVIVAAMDISERKRAEEALQRAHQELERRVAERTLELSRANEQLTLEIEERRRMERALRQSEEQYRGIFEAATEAFVIVGRGRRLVEVNPAACSMYGYSREELIGSSPKDVFHPDASEDFQRLERKVRSEGKFFSESRHQRRDGTPMDVEVRGRTFSYRGRPHLMVSVRDVTDRKNAETELARHRDQLEEIVQERTRELEAAQEELLRRERLAVLGRLTATVSHELRNPLGVIRSSGFYLKRKLGDGDPKIVKHVDRIEDQIEICDSIVADLLEYTRGRRAQTVEGEISLWVEEVLDQISTPPQVEVVRRLAVGLPEVPFDKDKIRRVVVNLMDNAIQAVLEQKEKWADTTSYRGRVTVTTLPLSGGVAIEVQDNGIGMDVETKERAFDPLFTTRARGTGLGLAIVQKAAAEHGGSVELDSEIERGTTVTVILPLRPPT